MAESDLYGLEMLWQLEKKNVVTKSDLLMVFVHWYLTKHNFRNVGVGDDKTLTDNIERSELLPVGWNGNNGTYSLRYALGNDLYILHGIVSQDTMVMNLLQVKTLNVSNAAFDLNATVRAIHGDTAKTLIVDIHKQTQRLNNELKNAIVEDVSPSIGTQTDTPRAESSRSNPSENRRYTPRHDNNRDYRPHHPPPGVGRGDLDPLGRLGGGMLMDPRNAFPDLGNLGGLRQPRPRFDPFGPNPLGINRAGPDNDHLRPPGYDDMFM